MFFFFFHEFHFWNIGASHIQNANIIWNSIYGMCSVSFLLSEDNLIATCNVFANYRENCHACTMFFFPCISCIAFSTPEAVVCRKVLLGRWLLQHTFNMCILQWLARPSVLWSCNCANFVVFSWNVHFGEGFVCDHTLHTPRPTSHFVQS